MVTIKAAAQLTGLTVKAIRHYEHLGLVQPPERSDAGYRLYSSETIARLRQIQYYRELRFSLPEIRQLLDAPAETVQKAMKRQLLQISLLLEEYGKAQSVLNAALSAGVNKPTPTFSKHNLAIVNIDLQNDILEGGALPNKRICRILPILAALFEQARALNVPIIYICDWHEQGDPELLIWNDHMMAGSRGAQIIDDVAPKPCDYIVKKNLFNGFINTELQSVLSALNAQTLLFTGWRTHVCVAQTAIEAFYRGYRVIIAEDGVDSTTQKEHEYGMSLMQINYGFETCPCQSVLEMLLHPQA